MVSEKATFGLDASGALRRRSGACRGSGYGGGIYGGTLADPTYADVCTGKTGHAEVVEVTYDPAHASSWDLLDLFWSIHDPTTPNRQGPDIGTRVGR